MSSIKDMVKDGKQVEFLYFRSNELWYQTECGFKFAVPVSDTGDGTFYAKDKAMLFMRYIRKQLEANAEGLAEATRATGVTLETENGKTVVVKNGIVIGAQG